LCERPQIGEGRGRRLLSRCRCLSPSAWRPGISAPSRSPHAWMARKPTGLHRSAFGRRSTSGADR